MTSKSTDETADPVTAETRYGDDCEASTPHNFSGLTCGGETLEAEPDPSPEHVRDPEPDVPIGAGNFVPFDGRETIEVDVESLETRSFRPVRPREVGRGPRAALAAQPAQRQTQLYRCSLEVYERPRVGASIATVIALIAGILCGFGFDR